MKLGNTQELLTQQKVIMTPALQQAISILHMSSIELRDYLQTAIEENPMLEEAEKKMELSEQEHQVTMEQLESWIRNNSGYQIYGMLDEAKDSMLQSLQAKPETLYEHLTFQLNVSCENTLDQKIGDYIIGCIDPKGYLTVEVPEIAEMLEVDFERAERVLHMVQTFQPYGVGARNLVECLLLQLEQYGHLDELHAEIVKKHLIELGAGKLNKIASSLRASIQAVQDACDYIRSLDPKPGLQYGYEDIRYIVPDVIVEKMGDEYMITVNDTGFPKVVFNRMCADMLKDPEFFEQSAVKYMQDKMNAGIWLMKCLDQRRMTLYRVVSTIVQMQRGFFDYGIHHIKPLTMKQLADMLEIHESTVSRAIAHKYVQTPRGVFEMKYFFSSSIDGQDGDEKLSSTYIKSLLADIVAKENAYKPLSDQLIVRQLDLQGVTLSRRTVAKYRKELSIPTAIGRKRYQPSQ